MKRQPGIWILSVLLLLPILWLTLSTDVAGGGRASLLFAGALLSAGAVLSFAWRAHARGALLPHHCATCEHPMARLRPGEVRPPRGSSVDRGAPMPRWRCRHCGRLV